MSIFCVKFELIIPFPILDLVTQFLSHKTTFFCSQLNLTQSECLYVGKGHLLFRNSIKVNSIQTQLLVQNFEHDALASTCTSGPELMCPSSWKLYLDDFPFSGSSLVHLEPELELMSTVEKLKKSNCLVTE